MSNVTRILSAIEEGDPHAAEQLLTLVYDELRRLAAQRLAQEKPGQTLQATQGETQTTLGGPTDLRSPCFGLRRLIVCHLRPRSGRSALTAAP